MPERNKIQMGYKIHDSCSTLHFVHIFLGCMPFSNQTCGQRQWTVSHRLEKLKWHHLNERRSFFWKTKCMRDCKMWAINICCVIDMLWERDVSLRSSIWSERETLNLKAAGSSPAVGFPFGMQMGNAFVLFLLPKSRKQATPERESKRFPRPGLEPGSHGWEPCILTT